MVQLRTLRNKAQWVGTQIWQVFGSNHFFQSMVQITIFECGSYTSYSKTVLIEFVPQISSSNLMQVRLYSIDAKIPGRGFSAKFKIGKL